MVKLDNIKTKSRILVVGDAILDEYMFGSVRRISPEAPVPILKYSESEYRLGGAANVAANAASFGVDVSLLGVCGNDKSAEIICRRLGEENIHSVMVRADHGVTILKRRVIANNQQLLRIDDEVEFDSVAAESVKSTFNKIYKGYDLVVLSDYGKGTLVDHQYYIDLCRKLSIPVLVDPKGGDFDKYIEATLITPNLREFEEIMGSSSSQEEFLSKVLSLKKQLKLQCIVVTLGSDGMVLLDKDETVTFFKAEAKKVFDVSGAGDTVIAILASLMAQGEGVSAALNIANVAAGIAVGKVGTCIITKAEINRHLRLKNNLSSWKVDLDYLVQETLYYKEQGKTIVMTNGCFDILHSGHVDYLEKSKALGDVLIVALNGDESITRLKGSSRPINSFESRARMLASLKFVDYVIRFDDDTPEKIYSQLLPHVLVKGGDYVDKVVAGADSVVANGGKVEFIPLLEGFSSTGLIEKILNGAK